MNDVILEKRRTIVAYIDHLLQQLTDAQDYTVSIMSIEKARRDDKQLAKLNLSYSFFNIACKALWNSLYMSLSCVFDKNNDTINFLKVLNICQSDKDILKQQMGMLYSADDRDGGCQAQNRSFDVNVFYCEQMEIIRQSDNILKNLKSLRDKKYAHNDKQFLNSNPEYISVSEARKLIMLASKGLNTLLV